MRAAAQKLKRIAGGPLPPDKNNAGWYVRDIVGGLHMIYTISVRGNGADVVAADGFRWYEAWPEGEEPDIGILLSNLYKRHPQRVLPHE